MSTSESPHVTSEKINSSECPKSADNEDSPRKKRKVACPADSTDSSSDTVVSRLRLTVGTEIVLDCSLKDKPYYNGEVFVVKKYGRDQYTLHMVNECHGLWGGSFTKSASFMEKHAHRITLSKGAKLIPIEYCLHSAVYDDRSNKNSAASPVHDTLQGWRWLESWERLVWTTCPTSLSYKDIYKLASVSIRDNFKPILGKKQEAFFILPPVGGSASVLQGYAAACERNDEKFSFAFEYAWLYRDKA